MEYNVKKIESYWQEHWLKEKLFKVEENSLKPKYYVLDMFPYPSASGLHVGHIEGYTATDIVSRFKRMQGFNVLHPMGWDAFGLPAEQFALKTGKNPKEFTYENIKNFKTQIIHSGKGLDWEREFATCDSDYYRWTQWIFKKLYENGLAELKGVEVNFCAELGTVLANDEIVLENGVMYSQRGHYPVTKKVMKQWVLLITKYAGRLLDDLELLDWPESLKEMQRNWIGKSEGAIINFQVWNNKKSFEVFTTRADTIYGVTYCVLSPEHPNVLDFTTKEEYPTVIEYLKQTKQKSEMDRLIGKEKTGVFSGSYAINPLNGKKIPIFIADYVLASYGTGAIMAVPAHDERDAQFALIKGLEVIEVLDLPKGAGIETDGVHINSPLINGLLTKDATNKIIDFLESRHLGSKKINYRLRDWIFSRQRYWGEPFPLYFDHAGKIHLMADEQLPLELPFLENIKPSGDGTSPLSHAKDWLTNYGKLNGLRDTNTMPQLAGSSWYFIGYILKRHYGFIPFDSLEAKKELDKWLPVDLYIGGTEHAVGHLLYARFWTKFFYDLGYVSVKEPFIKLVNQGMILGADGHKMSKSLGNTVNPEEIISQYGADTLRIYEMFLGPLADEKPWNPQTIAASKKFLERVLRMYEFLTTDETKDLNYIYHATVKKVTTDYQNLSFNTAISALMIFVNEVYKVGKINTFYAREFLKLLNPLAPHLTEEINKVILKNKEELVYATWPTWDEKALSLDQVELVIQINGKIRSKIVVATDLTDEELKKLVLADEKIKLNLENLSVKKFIIIKNKIVNLVV
ncbi:MAG: leucine--tRNA ligase [Acholeplasmatales bacterium]|jgi:leucyl-tRNA synthetase|nr:leucine--tRNA ligase [Acholeplasmatales bacterium]